MKKILILLIVLTFGAAVVWLSDVLHEPIEVIEELVGEEYTFAHTSYFQTKESDYYSISINGELDNFNSRILSRRETLSSPYIDVYTWDYFTHKCTIWIGTTKDSTLRIIDAIRYQRDVQF